MEKARRVEGYRMETLDDELLLYNPAQARIIALNPSASLVWQLLDGTRTTDEIVELIRGGYPEAGAAVAGEVAGLLETLRGAGAVEPA